MKIPAEPVYILNIFSILFVKAEFLYIYRYIYTQIRKNNFSNNTIFIQYCLAQTISSK